MHACVNDIKMYYTEKGTGSPLIFLHGLGENADFWRGQTEFFSAGFRVIRMDQRGHHRTEDGPGIITLDLLRNDVIALMDYLEIEKAHFVGHSMGAIVLQDVIAYHRERFLTLTLCSACAYFADIAGFLEPRLHMINNHSMEEVGAAIAAKACRADFPSRNPEVYRDIKETLQANRKEPYRQCTTILGDPRCDHRDALSHLDVPALIAVGMDDQTTPLAGAQLLNALISGSFLVIIPDAAHMAPLENPQAFNLALACFLALDEPAAVRAVLKK